MTCIPHPDPAFLAPVPSPVARLGPRSGPGLFGTLILEVVTPDGTASVPDLPGWELRAWPVARLGDATLEARPHSPGPGAAELARELRRAGYTPLGPVRTARRRGPPPGSGA